MNLVSMRGEQEVALVFTSGRRSILFQTSNAFSFSSFGSSFNSLKTFFPKEKEPKEKKRKQSKKKKEEKGYETKKKELKGLLSGRLLFGTLIPNAKYRERVRESKRSSPHPKSL